LLDVCLSGVNILRPCYEAAGTLTDFAIVYLNPAGQRMTGLGAQPGGTLLSYFPSSIATGILTYYRRVYEAGATDTYEVYYQADGLDNYFQLAARRSGDLLVVSFTDTADQDRTPAEQALRASQAREQAALAEAQTQRQRLYHVLMQLPAQVAVYQGPDHIYQLVNPNYQRKFPHRAFVGRPFREGMPEAEGLGVVALFDQVYQTGEPYYGHELEGWFDFGGHGQPEQFFFELSLHPLRNAQGEVEGVLDFSYDVTEQVFARRQLQQLNQELESRVQQRTQELLAAQQATERQRWQWHELFRQAPASICIFDGPEWVYEFVNPRYQAMFPGRELLGKRLVDALPEVADQPLMTILHRVYDTGESFEVSEMLVPLARTAEGPVEDIYFDLTYQVRRNEAGQIDGFTTYAYDVTERVLARREREAQQHLRQLNEELETRVRQRTRQLETQRAGQQRLFREAPMALVVLRGPQFIIEQANERAEAIWGVPETEVLGRPHFEAVPGSAGQGFEELLTGVLQTGTPLVLPEVLIELKRAHTGRPDKGYYSVIFQPLHDEDEHVNGIAVMWVEVTDQVLARRQVQDLNAELQNTNQELHTSNNSLTRTNADLDNFIYTASHDLKTPISNIEGLLLLLDELLPPAVQQDELVQPILQRMHDSVERFRRTIDHLTDVSKLQAEFAQPAAVVSLATVVEEVRQDLWTQLREAGAQVEVDVDDTQPRVFSPKNLRSLVYNLLSNALKYRHPERAPLVRIRCRPTGDWLVLTVQDNGLGLSETQQQRLFQLFQRLHTHVEGSGVGLYAVKKIVEHAGGTITVASQLDVGTTFTLTFPA